MFEELEFQEAVRDQKESASAEENRRQAKLGSPAVPIPPFFFLVQGVPLEIEPTPLPPQKKK